MIQFFSKKKKGFTLIELLVVIAVIGMLAGIVLVSFGPTRAKARDTKRQVDLREIMIAMEMCYGNSNCGLGLDQYPATAGGITQIDTDGDPLYLSPVSCDPSGCTVGYNWTDNSGAPSYRYYCVYAKLETEANTWFCASNKGLHKKTFAGYTPINTDCCGVNVTQ